MPNATVKNRLSDANPNNLPDLFRKLGLGDILRQSIATPVRRSDPAADAAQAATLEQVGLPDDARACTVLRAYSRASGNMVTGELTVDAANTTPGTGHIAVAPNGDIVVLAADQITDLDLEYMPMKGDVVTLTDMPVVANSLVLPPSVTGPGVLYLIDCNATAGTATGRKIVLAPGSAAAATKASLVIAKTSVLFHAADAVTKATVKLLVVAAKDVPALLGSDAQF